MSKFRMKRPFVPFTIIRFCLLWKTNELPVGQIFIEILCFELNVFQMLVMENFQSLLVSTFVYEAMWRRRNMATDLNGVHRDRLLFPGCVTSSSLCGSVWTSLWNFSDSAL